MSAIFFFTNTPTTKIYTLSLHDALPISRTYIRAIAISALAHTISNLPSRSSKNGQAVAMRRSTRSEEHTSELQSRQYLVCRLLLEKKKKYRNYRIKQLTNKQAIANSQ